MFSGERFPIDVAVEAPGAAHARVELTAEGKTIGASEVDLLAGLNRLRLQASINAVGAVALAGRIAGVKRIIACAPPPLRHPQTLLAPQPLDLSCD